MRLPKDFLIEEDIEELNHVCDTLDVIADVFSGGDNSTTEALRMAAGLLRTGASRLELIADRVEQSDVSTI